jgi:hypothetical protein
MLLLIGREFDLGLVALCEPRAPSVLHSLATEHTDARFILSIKISVDNLESLLLVFLLRQQA